MDAAKLLSLLSSAKNQRILNHLAAEPAHPKAIATALDMSDSEVSRTLRSLEKAGMVHGDWTRIDVGGKETNVKQYALAVTRMEVTFRTGGIRIALGDEGTKPTLTVPAYHFLPPENALFVGRGDLLTLLDADERVLILQGLPGVGKSALAAEIARRSGRHVLWHEATSTDTERRILNKIAVFLSGWGDEALLEALQAGVEDEETLASHLLSGLDKAPFLLVVDDYHTLVDEGAVRLVHKLLARVQHLHVILTTRAQPRYIPPEQSIHVVHLEGFRPDDTLGFLREKGLDVEEDLARRVHDRFGGHPLFLNFFAEAVKSGRKTTADFFDEVPETELETYLWDELWSHLEDREQAVLQSASVFEGGFTKEALQAVLPETKLPQTLFLLERKLLLTRSATVYHMHEVVRDFAYGKLPDPARVHARAAALREDDATLEGRLRAMHHWLKAGKKQEVARLLDQNLDLDHFDVVEEGLHLMYQTVLESFEEGELPPGLWMNVLDDRADILLKRGEAASARAHYDRVAAMARERGDHAVLADVLWKTSLALAALGKNAAAREAVADGLAACPPEAAATRARLEAQQGRLGAE